MNDKTRRIILIEDSTWEKLKKLAHPEGVSLLVRKVLREYCNGQRD